MVKIFLSIGSFLLLILLPRAEDKWIWQNPLPQANSLNALTFTDTKTGYAVGDNGAVLKTADGGLTWAFDAVGYSRFEAVQFPEENVGFATGEKGTVIKTVDAGNHWMIQPAATERNLHALSFRDKENGFTVGDSGTFLQTTDGGKVWKANAGLPMVKLTGVHFPSEKIGFVCARDGQVYKTLDGGVTWGATRVDSAGLNSVWFSNADRGYLAGDTAIYGTIDGGNHWQRILHKDGMAFRGTHFENGDTLHVLSPGYFSFTSGDGGATWTQEPTDSLSNDIRAMFFTNGKRGYAVGNNGFMGETTDRGAHWSVSTRSACAACTGGPTPFISGIEFPSVSTGYVATWGYLMKTMNGGKTWERISTFPSNPVLNMHFTDAQNGVVCGNLASDTGNHPNGFIDRSTDGGLSWKRVDSWPGHTLRCMAFPSNRVGYAMGYGFGLKTVDAGMNWAQIASPPTGEIDLIDFIDEETGFASDHRSLFKTTDGGAHWDSLPSYLNPLPAKSGIFTMRFLDRQTGFLAFDSAKILKTGDGGTTWRRVATPLIQAAIQNIRFISSTMGYTVGKKGLILKTTDAGETWIRQDAGVGAPLFEIDFPDTSTGFVVGLGETYSDNPIILKLERSVGDGIAGPRYPIAGRLRLGPDGEVRYTLSKPSRVRARILRPNGSGVTVLVDTREGVGEHRLVLPTKSVTRGSYIFECRIDGSREAISIFRL